MAVENRPGRVQSIIQISGAFAAIIVAIVGLFAYFISSPIDLNNKARVLFGRYSVTIDAPVGDAAVGPLVNIKGKATLPSDWNLVVLVQTPGQLRYYVSSGGAITVTDGGWTLPKVPFGSTDVKARPAELGKDYKIIALLLDEKGQEQVEAALSRPGDSWLSSVPHNAAQDIVRVHLSL